MKSFNRAAGLDRGNANILANRGTVLNELDRSAEALADFERAIDLLPHSAAARYGAGSALKKLGRSAEALKQFDVALELDPKFAEAFDGRGQALVELNRPIEALESYTTALTLEPSRAESWYNRGICQTKLRRFRAAVADFYCAINRAPTDKAEYYVAAATACSEIGYSEDALSNVNRALELDRDLIEARILRGIVLQGLQRNSCAVEDFDHLLQLQPEDSALYCLRDMALRSLHRWRENSLDEASLRDLLLTSPSVPSPFLVLSMSADADLQRMVALRYASKLEKEVAAPALNPAHDRIRVGYFSADFHDHATMYLVAELLESHDRNRFELTAFSFGPNDKSKWRARAENAVDRFFDLREKTDAEIAQLSRDLEIDIAIDLKGYTLHARPLVFADRAAPVQVNYLGYPGTMGCSFYDYIIADTVLIPPGYDHFYTEKIIRLPDTYQPNRQLRPIELSPMTRADAGLPEDAIVFCSFNQSYKLTEMMFDSWMHILRRVDGSRLWIWVKTEEARCNLRSAAEKRGIDSARLHFAETLPLEEHLARLPLADLFLDTFPYSAHTTASDALRVGLPIITCTGQSFASRVAASLLTAAGCPELIAPTLGDYVELAVALGQDNKRLQAVSARLKQNASSSPLFDSKRYAQHFERALEHIYQRAANGLAAQAVDVPPLGQSPRVQSHSCMVHQGR